MIVTHIVNDDNVHTYMNINQDAYALILWSDILSAVDFALDKRVKFMITASSLSNPFLELIPGRRMQRKTQLQNIEMLAWTFVIIN